MIFPYKSTKMLFTREFESVIIIVNDRNDHE